MQIDITTIKAIISFFCQKNRFLKNFASWIRTKSLKANVNYDGALFITEFIKSPRTVGSIYPSSKMLAKRMAEKIDLKKEEIVLELGGGTGKVTRALLNKGVLPSQLVVIEKSPKLTAALHKKFPHVDIIEGDATELLSLLKKYDQKRIRYIISGLPFRSLSPDITDKIMQQINPLMQNNTKLVQFTYSLTDKLPKYFADFLLLKSSIVWANLPPARVNVLGYAG